MVKFRFIIPLFLFILCCSGVGAVKSYTGNSRIDIAANCPLPPHTHNVPPLRPFSWREAGQLREALSNIGAIAYRDKIFLTGGLGEKGISANLTMFDPYTGCMCRLQEMKTPRFSHACAIIKDKLYVFGGISRSNGKDQYLDSIEAYDFSARKWEDAGRLPSPRARFALATFNHKVYIIGGQERENSTTSRVDVYDPAKGTWQAGKELPEARNRHCAVSINNAIYVIGGQDNNANTLGTVLKLSSAQNTWKQKTSMKDPRMNFAASRLGERIIVAGGWKYEKGRKSFFKSSETYDPGTNRWTSGENLTLQRDGDRAVALHGKVYVFGGFDGEKLTSGIEEGAWVTTQSFWKLDEPMKLNLVSYVADHSVLAGNSMKEISSIGLTPDYQADITNIILQNLINMGFPFPQQAEADKKNFFIKFFEYPQTLNHAISAKRVLDSLLIFQTGQGEFMRGFVRERTNVTTRKGYIAPSNTKFSLENPFPPLTVPTFPVTVKGESVSPQDFFDRNQPFAAIYLKPGITQEPVSDPDKQAEMSAKGVQEFNWEIRNLYSKTYCGFLLDKEKSETMSYFLDDAEMDNHIDSNVTIRIIRLPYKPFVFENYRDLPMPQDPEKILLTGLLLLYEDTYNLTGEDKIEEWDSSRYQFTTVLGPYIKKKSLPQNPVRSRVFEVGSVMTVEKK